MDPEIRHLRAICAIAEMGSLSKAAVRLGVSQPALTALLQRIERSVGGQLFSRGRNGSQPTELGERALRQARLVLAELDSFVGEVAGISRYRSDVMRLGSADLACVATMLRYVSAALPGSDVTLQVEPSGRTLALALAHDRLDLAVIGMMDHHDVPLNSDLVQRTIVPRQPVFVSIAASHQLARRTAIDLADLADEAWIAPPGADDGSLASLRAGCRRSGFEPRIQYQAPGGSGGALIASGCAVRLVEPSCRLAEGTVVRPLVGDPMWYRLVLVRRRQRLTDQTFDAVFKAVVRAYIEQVALSEVYSTWWADHPEVHPFLD